MTVSVNRTAAILDDFFYNFLIKKDSMHQNRWQIFSKGPGRASEIGANVGSTFASRSPNAVLSTLPDVIVFL